MFVVILKPPLFYNISESWFSQVLPCLLCRFLLQLFSWTHTYPFGLRGDVGTPNPTWVGVECEKSQWSPSDLGIWNQESHHCTINVHLCIMENKKASRLSSIVLSLLCVCVILPHTPCVCLNMVFNRYEKWSVYLRLCYGSWIKIFLLKFSKKLVL